MTDHQIGVASLIITVAAIFAPYRYPNMPRWVTDLVLVIAVIAMTLAFAPELQRLIPIFGPVLSRTNPQPHQIPFRGHPTVSRPKLAKAYSQSEKDELFNAMRDLSKILDEQGDDISKESQVVISNWQNRTFAMPQTSNMKSFFAEIDAVSATTVALNGAIYDQRGLLKKYISYNLEIENVLHFPPGSSMENRITEFNSAVQQFRNSIQIIRLALTYDDQRLSAGVIDAVIPSFQKFQSANEIFNRWLLNTKVRINDFRRELQ